MDSAQQFIKTDVIGQRSADNLFQHTANSQQIVIQDQICHIGLAINNQHQRIGVFRINHVDKLFIAVVNGLGVQQVEVQICLLDKHCATSRTGANQIAAFIVVHEYNGHGICAGIDRCFSTRIGIT